ncbi:UNVERIFIED_CONTAM: hypothetical protein FKN15_024331 [Acipenser sinensis]
MALCQGRADDTPGIVAQAGSCLHGLLHSPLPPSPPRKKSSCFKRSVDSEQMEKLWVALSYQGTRLTELLRERSVLPAQSVPLGSQGAMSADCQQDDMLTLTASEEVGEQELAFLSEDVESDSTSLAVKLSLLAAKATIGSAAQHKDRRLRPSHKPCSSPRNLLLLLPQGTGPLFRAPSGVLLSVHHEHVGAYYHSDRNSLQF